MEASQAGLAAARAGPILWAQIRLQAAKSEPEFAAPTVQFYNYSGSLFSFWQTDLRFRDPFGAAKRNSEPAAT